MTAVDQWAPDYVGPDEPAEPRQPSRLSVWAKGAGPALRKRAGALAGLVPDHFTLSQVAGGAAASVGVFELWGLGVGLLATGLCVVAASWIVEGKH